MPSAAHLFYIPGILLLGFSLGFVYGARAARNEIDRQQRRRKR